MKQGRQLHLKLSILQYKFLYQNTQFKSLHINLSYPIYRDGSADKKTFPINKTQYYAHDVLVTNRQIIYIYIQIFQFLTLHIS